MLQSLCIYRLLGLNNLIMVAEGGFDPPTSGLWAQHASSAFSPPRPGFDFPQGSHHDETRN